MRILSAFLLVSAAAISAQPSIFAEDDAQPPATELTSLQGSFSEISALPGGSFGVMAVDLASGQTVGSTGVGVRVGSGGGVGVA